MVAPAQPHLKSLEDVITWASYHEGQITAYWAEQFALNSSMKVRVASLERRLWVMSGASAGIGGAIGSLLPILLTNQ